MDARPGEQVYGILLRYCCTYGLVNAFLSPQMYYVAKVHAVFGYTSRNVMNPYRPANGWASFFLPDKLFFLFVRDLGFEGSRMFGDETLYMYVIRKSFDRGIYKT